MCSNQIDHYNIEIDSDGYKIVIMVIMINYAILDVYHAWRVH